MQITEHNYSLGYRPIVHHSWAGPSVRAVVERGVDFVNNVYYSPVRLSALWVGLHFFGARRLTFYSYVSVSLPVRLS